jgi:hypothetical protein
MNTENQLSDYEKSLTESEIRQKRINELEEELMKDERYVELRDLLLEESLLP